MLGNSLIIPSTISSNSCSEMSEYLCPEQRFHTHGFFVLRYFTHIQHRCDLPRCKFHVQKKLKLVPGNEAARSSPLAKVHNLCPRRHIGSGDNRPYRYRWPTELQLDEEGSKLFLKTEYSPHNEPQHCTTNQDEIVLNHPHKNCFVLLKGWCLWRICLVRWISPRPWTLLWPPAAMLKSGSFSRPRVSRCSLTAMPSPSAERNSEKPGMPYRKAECKYRTHNSAAWRIKVEKGKHDVEN